MSILENTCLTTVNVYATVYDMPMNNEGAYEFPDDDEAQGFALDRKAIAEIQAYLAKPRAVPLQLAGLAETARLREEAARS